MKINFADPILIICVGIIFMCLAVLVWAVSKFRKSEALASDDTADLDDAVPASDSDLPFRAAPSRYTDPAPEASDDADNPFETPAPRPSAPKSVVPEPVLPPTPSVVAQTPPVQAPAAAPAAAPSPVLTREVSDRLEMMNQRLSEMQNVLTKHSGGGAAAPQGFSPETVDKLLKIIGNVITQVDILHKNLALTKPAGAAMSSPSAAPASTVTPAAPRISNPMGPLSAAPKPTTPPPSKP